MSGLKGYVGDTVLIGYDTKGTQAGLTDVVTDIFLPNNNTATPDLQVTLTEVGATGIYRGTYTPTIAGVYRQVTNSVSSNPTIENVASSHYIGAKDPADIETDLTALINAAETNINNNIDAEAADIKGAGFGTATHSLVAIKNAVDAIAANVGAPQAMGMNF